MQQHQGSMYQRREEPYTLPQNPSSLQLPLPPDNMNNAQGPPGPLNPMMTLPSTQSYGQPPPPPNSSNTQNAQETPPPSYNHAVMPNGGAYQPPPANLEHLKGQRGIRDGIEFRLIAGQQPIRARMCGFGDKDRRPITPPPCFELQLWDTRHNTKIDITDHMADYLVATVDLWDKFGATEVNLVRSSSGAPSVSISTSSLASYPPPPEHVFVRSQVAPNMGGQYDPYARQQMQSTPHPQYQQQQQPPSVGYYAQGGVAPVQTGYASYPPGGQYSSQQNMSIQPVQQAAGLFTRNLIGSLTVNAFKLNDPEGKIGLWFIFQDLSIRTEGIFRLKVSFVDVGNGNNGLNTGRAPILATCYTDSFQVYSAKKFPGVIESTPLSKCFAGQGIKIPIRKDGPKTLSNQEEYDEDHAHH